MNAVVQNTAPTPIADNTLVQAEELGNVLVLRSMLFHAGQRREEELANQNPSSLTTKVYVMVVGHGPYIANAVLDQAAAAGFRLTHLQKVESRAGFMAQINREVDRSEEGEAFLAGSWFSI